MNILQNMEYSKVLSTVLVSTTLAVSPVSASNDKEDCAIIQKASYDVFIDYSSSLQSTNNALIKNDVEMLKVLDLEEIKEKIFTEYKVHVNNIWVPADGQIEKTCVFVSLENQDILASENDDFELDLYHKVEGILSKSQFYNMIALM